MASAKEILSRQPPQILYRYLVFLIYRSGNHPPARICRQGGSTRRNPDHPSVWISRTTENYFRTCPVTKSLPP